MKMFKSILFLHHYILIVVLQEKDILENVFIFQLIQVQKLLIFTNIKINILLKKIFPSTHVMTLNIMK